jgi:hypothetical protein
MPAAGETGRPAGESELTDRLLRRAGLPGLVDAAAVRAEVAGKLAFFGLLSPLLQRLLARAAQDGAGNFADAALLLAAPFALGAGDPLATPAAAAASLPSSPLPTAGAPQHLVRVSRRGRPRDPAVLATPRITAVRPTPSPMVSPANGAAALKPGASRRDAATGGGGEDPAARDVALELAMAGAQPAPAGGAYAAPAAALAAARMTRPEASRHDAATDGGGARPAARDATLVLAISGPAPAPTVRVRTAAAAALAAAPMTAVGARPSPAVSREIAAAAANPAAPRHSSATGSGGEDPVDLNGALVLGRSVLDRSPRRATPTASHTAPSPETSGHRPSPLAAPFAVAVGAAREPGSLPAARASQTRTVPDILVSELRRPAAQYRPETAARELRMARPPVVAELPWPVLPRVPAPFAEVSSRAGGLRSGLPPTAPAPSDWTPVAPSPVAAIAPRPITPAAIAGAELERLADKVSRMIARRVAVERERRGR